MMTVPLPAVLALALATLVMTILAWHFDRKARAAYARGHTDGLTQGYARAQQQTSMTGTMIREQAFAEGWDVAVAQRTVAAHEVVTA